MEFQESPGYAKTSFLHVLLTFSLFCSLLLVLQCFAISGADNPVSTNLNASVQLTEGKLQMAYSSENRLLQIGYFSEEKEQNYEVTFNSSNNLGLLILVEGVQISYIVEVLGEEAEWAPLSDLLGDDKSEYQIRSRIKQKPGWEVLIIEKAEKLSA